MIRHVVLWKLKNAADAPHFKARLDSCKGLTDGMLDYETHIRTDTLEANVDVMLISTFRDAAALAAYQAHPQHKLVGAEIGPLRESRHVLDAWVGHEDGGQA